MTDTNTRTFAPARMAQRTIRALNATDNMPSKYRMLVHEFGSEIVNEYIQNGVEDPATIRRLVIAAWNGSRSAPNRTSHNNGVPGAIATLDWVLIQAGAQISAATLLAILHRNNYAVMPMTASRAMIDASMDVDLTDRIVTKREKHHERLIAAIKAGSRDLWPHLWDRSP